MKTRTFSGLELRQIGRGGRWETLDGRYLVERFEGYLGGWRLMEAGVDGEFFTSSVKSAAREIRRRAVSSLPAEGEALRGCDLCFVGAECREHAKTS